MPIGEYQPSLVPSGTAAVNPAAAKLTASANSEATAYAKYFNHTQTIQGIWRRKWVFDTTPTVSNSQLSGCPQVMMSYIDVNVTHNVTEKFESASFSGGTFQQTHDITYWSDSVSGGWGTSGGFWTSKAGTLRRGAEAGDSESIENLSYNVIAAKQPGAYNASVDTSAAFSAQFFSDVVLAGAAANSTKFIPGIVNI